MYPRARMAVFLGYPPGIKGYKLYDIKNKELFKTRDVFRESIFPYHSVVDSENIIDQFLMLVLQLRLLLQKIELLLVDQQEFLIHHLHCPTKSIIIGTRLYAEMRRKKIPRTILSSVVFKSKILLS